MNAPARSTAHADFWFDDVGVITVRLRPETVLDKAAIEELTAVRQELPGDVILVDVRAIKSASLASFDATAEGRGGSAAVALLVGGAVSVVVGNFFLKMYRPPFDCRLFREEEAARTWLISRVVPTKSAVAPEAHREPL